MKKILKKISANIMCLNCNVYINGIAVHKWLFSNLKTTDIDSIIKNKKKNKKKINKYNKNLDKISKNNKDNFILQKEISHHQSVHKFLLESYDVDANKLNKDYRIIEKLPDYNYYSKLFYGVTNSDIIDVNDSPKINIETTLSIFSKKELIELLDITKKMFPMIKVNFSDTLWNMMVSWFNINIPNKDVYNLREVIVLFFHEMSHFIRMYNTYNNLWTRYSFYNNYLLEEWIALYNEHLYWNQIIDYGEYYPWYDKVYSILLKNESEDEKKRKMEELLSLKWFSKEKIDKYYQRFYKRAPIGWTSFLLKETIYSRALTRVKDLTKNGYSIAYLITIRWDLDTIWYFIKEKNIKPNNIHIEYFEMIRDMIIKIKKVKR